MDLDELLQINSSNLKSKLIITKTSSEAEHLKEKLVSRYKKIGLIPNTETLPYDFFSPPSNLINERLYALSQNFSENKALTIISIDTLISPSPKPQQILNKFGDLKVNDKLNKKDFIESLMSEGYSRVEIVNEIGTYAERGSIIDVYITSLENPIRVELFDDEIASMRFFNTKDQLTINNVNEIQLKTPYEYPLDKESVDKFKQNWRSSFDSYEEDCEIFRSISKQKKSSGAEMYLPFFYGNKYSPIDYLKNVSLVFIDEKFKDSLNDFRALINSRFDEYGHDQTRPLIHPDLLYATSDELNTFLENKELFLYKNNIDILSSSNEAIQDANENNNPFTLDFNSLPKPGERVVHLSHGIGLFIGLKNIDTGKEITDCLEIEFAESSKLYVPIHSTDLISKYFGPDNIKLDFLGSKKWLSRKERALKQSFDVAAELLEIQAKRFEAVSKKYIIPMPDYDEFSKGFPYQETSDQLRVINEVELDLTADKPMDRIICGEVGFGKTEVALRAIFIACFNNKLSCMLVPTTLLAQQHYDNFIDRFKGFGLEIESLSRNKSEKERRDILQKLNDGSLDLIIGTHALLQDSIVLNNLGLLIIDEEHKFGVRQKEKIKKIKDDVNVLSLSATPIPRSLNLALSELKDLSIIATSPIGRVPVNTFVYRYNENLIKEGIQRELMRGGQIYYLCNDLNLIEDRRLRLKKLFPNTEISIAHGKMKPKDIEKVMINFQSNKISILVCSTIIESGIDIPNANTLIVESANKLGLAQLHQLRGRVGRSKRQAFSYFLKDSGERNSKSESRLEALMESDSLSAGFLLAIKDLEIRGAGELLGSKQSGAIESVGLEMYMRLLKKTVKYLKEGLINDDINLLEDKTIINLGKSAYIPSKYLPDINQRLLAYSRISNSLSPDELKEIQLEMINRFGLLPEEVRSLMIQTEIALLARQKNIKEINSYGEYLILKFTNGSSHSLKKEEEKDESFNFLVEYISKI